MKHNRLAFCVKVTDQGFFMLNSLAGVVRPLRRKLEGSRQAEKVNKRSEMEVGKIEKVNKLLA